MADVIRKSFGILVIDGIRMYSPATIDADRPGSFKISYIPGDDINEQLEEYERERNKKYIRK